MPLTTLPNPGMDFTPLTPLTAEEMDDIVENIEAINNATIQTGSIADGAITKAKLAQDALDNYSLSEVDTGATWIDGKKIYKKTVDCGAQPADDSEKKVNPNISNLSKIIKMEAIALNNYGTFYPLPYPTGMSNGDYELCFYDNSIAICMGNVSLNITQIYVTLWFTKTS